MRQEDLIEVEPAVRELVMKREWDSLKDFAFEETVDAVVRSNDAEAAWRILTENGADPSRALRAIKAHPCGDPEIDPIALMETFMEARDGWYAHNVRFAIGCIVGHKHMQNVRTRGTRYWMATCWNDYARSRKRHKR